MPQRAVRHDVARVRRERARLKKAVTVVRLVDAPRRKQTKAHSPLLPKSFRANHWFGHRKGRTWTVVHSDALKALRQLPSDSVNCVITSPPYYWQRDYGVAGQAGQEDTVAGYVANMRRVFREVRRTLKRDGVMFLVLGDTYYSGKGRPTGGDPKQEWRNVARQKYRAVDKPGMGLPKKSLLGIPWRVALALQRDGWVIRSAVTWTKPKALAEPSVHDRPWNSSETVFILSKTGKYWFKREGLQGSEDVWPIASRPTTKSYRHAAPFPEALVERCLACGCRKRGLVLDPYSGSGTTIAVASRRGYKAVGIELSPAYCKLALRRIVFNQ